MAGPSTRAVLDHLAGAGVGLPCSREGAAQRAATQLPIVLYGLGKGGRHPEAPTPATAGECDCSGFLSWLLGFDRHLRIPGLSWLESTMICNDATGRRRAFSPVDPATAALPFVLSYPDRGGHQGHVALAVERRPDGALIGVDCRWSRSHGRKQRADRDSIQRGDVGWMLRKPGAVAMVPNAWAVDA